MKVMVLITKINRMTFLKIPFVLFAVLFSTQSNSALPEQEGGILINLFEGNVLRYNYLYDGRKVFEDGLQDSFKRKFSEYHIFNDENEQKNIVTIRVKTNDFKCNNPGGYSYFASIEGTVSVTIRRVRPERLVLSDIKFPFHTSDSGGISIRGECDVGDIVEDIPNHILTMYFLLLKQQAGTDVTLQIASAIEAMNKKAEPDLLDILKGGFFSTLQVTSDVAVGIGKGIGNAAVAVASSQAVRDSLNNSANAMSTSDMYKNNSRQYQAIIKQQREKREQKPTLYQQQLNRIAKSNDTDNKRQVSNTFATVPVITRPSGSVSTNTYSSGSKPSNRADSELENNSPRVREPSSCSPAYTTPSFTVEGKNAAPYNEVEGKVNSYMSKTCGKDKPSYNANPKIQCEVIEKIKSKYFSNLTRERCTSKPLTFTCCEQKAGSGRSM